MLTSIHPLGERARNNRWGVTIGFFVAGAVGAAALAGAALGWIGSMLPEGSWRWVAAVVIVGTAGTLDLVKVKPPGPHRQVNENWIGEYRGWVYGGGFGAQLGAGVATFVVTWGVWATLALMILLGDPAGSALVGGVFGLGRSFLPLAAGWIDRPSRLTGFSRVLSEYGGPLARGVGVALILSGVTMAVLI